MPALAGTPEISVGDRAGSRLRPTHATRQVDLKSQRSSLITDADAQRDANGNTLLTVIERVVEVTSSSPDRDRKTKRRAHAAARVPLYLLIDRDERQVTLFDDPRRDDYATMFVAAFGSGVRLPPPFSFTLATDGFVA
jgi:hypothetical protein